MAKPFDGNGPSIRDTLRKAQMLLRHPKIDRVRAGLDHATSLYYSVKIQPDPLKAFNASTGLLGLGIDLFGPEKVIRKKNISKASAKFQEIVDESWLLLDLETTEMVLPLLDLEKTILVIRDNDEEASSNTVWKYEVEPDVFFYWMEWEDSASGLFLPDRNEADFGSVLQYLRDLLWEPYERHIEINYDDNKDQIAFSQKREIPWGYEGDLGDDLIKRWKKFYEAGVRRSVILHGPPGTGKSTLAQQAARELQGRVCYVSVQILSRVSILALLDVLELLKPDVFIVDDLDRMGQADLDFFLSFFEESENQVPILIATTNHLEHVPDAMKRPGRFDEIWEMQPPRGEVRLRVIKYLAELEGVELSEEGAEKLLEVSEARDLPGAHLRELLRRIAIMGESELDFKDNDLTFNSEWAVLNHFERMGSTLGMEPIAEEMGYMGSVGSIGYSYEYADSYEDKPRRKVRSTYSGKRSIDDFTEEESQKLLEKILDGGYDE